MVHCVKLILFTFFFFAIDSRIIVVKANDVCLTKKCIRKCCGKTEYVRLITKTNELGCSEFDGKFVFTNITVYDNNDYSKKINRKFNDIFTLIPNMFQEVIKDDQFNNSTFFDMSWRYEIDSVYLTESGNLYTEHPNFYTRWRQVDFFCVDYILANYGVIEMFWGVYKNENLDAVNVFINPSSIISAVFLFMVLVVYIILPELRNFGGKILMAYVFNLMSFFIFLFFTRSESIFSQSRTSCIVLSSFTYFFIISAFCWMNVMSLDIWWTFRGYTKCRKIHRKGECFKFAMYCIYAWGVPFAMTIFLITLNEINLEDKPWIVKPQIPEEGCFISGGEKFLYMYIPMLILITFNWLFFLMTAYNVWRLSRGTSALNVNAAGTPVAHRTHMNRFRVYINLFVVMGISWIFEIAHFFMVTASIWYVTEIFNNLIGIPIFIIFIFKKDIYRKLLKRYHIFMNSTFKQDRNNPLPNPKYGGIEFQLKRSESEVSDSTMI